MVLTVLARGQSRADERGPAPRAVLALGTAKDATAALPAPLLRQARFTLAHSLRRHAPGMALVERRASSAVDPDYAVDLTVQALSLARSRHGLALRCAVTVRLDRIAADGSEHWVAEATGRGRVIDIDSLSALVGAGDECMRAALEAVTAEQIAPYLLRAARRGSV